MTRATWLTGNDKAREALEKTTSHRGFSSELVVYYQVYVPPV